MKKMCVRIRALMQKHTYIYIYMYIYICVCMRESLGISAILRFYLLIRYMLDFLEVNNLPCRHLPRASWQAQTSHTPRRATYIARSKREPNQLGTEVLTSFPDICSQPNLGGQHFKRFMRFLCWLVVILKALEILVWVHLRFSFLRGFNASFTEVW